MAFSSPRLSRRPPRWRLAAGRYRHIDTAYGNERQVGDAIRESGLDRSGIFVATKARISDYGYDQALPSDFDRKLDAYRALEKLLADGKVRAIGVSNFMVGHLTRLLDAAQVVPPA